MFVSGNICTKFQYHGYMGALECTTFDPLKLVDRCKNSLLFVFLSLAMLVSNSRPMMEVGHWDIPCLEHLTLTPFRRPLELFYHD